MNVVFYKNFTKKENSTKQPAVAGTTHTCRMKDNCSILNPIFEIENIDLTYNYCQFNGRYYFITDIVLSTNKIYEIHCTVDVLATYKSSIGDLTTFVERAASSYDVMVPDNYLSESTDIISMEETSISLSVTPRIFYMVLVFGKNGFIPYVFTDFGDAAQFYNTGNVFSIDANNQVTFNDFVSLVKNIGVAFTASDISNYMGDIRVIPYEPVQGVTPVFQPINDIVYGYVSFQSTSSLARLTPEYFYQDATFTLTDPGNIYSDFRAYDPRFSQYRIYLPGVGIQTISSNEAGKKDLKIGVYMDYINAKISYRIFHDNGSDIAKFDGELGCTMPAMGSSQDVFGSISSGMNIASSIGSFNPFGAVGAAADTAKKILQPQVVAQSPGIGNVQFMIDNPNIIYYVENYGCKDFPTDQAGRPLFQNTKISTLSGYIKCGSASLDITGFESEKASVNNFLNSGFYYE